MASSTTVVQILFNVCLLGLFFHGASAATTYMVGSDAGWIVPGNNSFYEDWAAGKTFMVGDKLEFKWTGTHTVSNISKADYESCTEPTENIFVTSPVTITLETEGTHYYICTITGHCQGGQKVAVTVKGDSTASTPAASTPAGGASGGTDSTPSAPTPESNAAPSIALMGVFGTVCLGVATALLL